MIPAGQMIMEQEMAAATDQTGISAKQFVRTHSNTPIPQLGDTLEGGVRTDVGGTVVMISLFYDDNVIFSQF